MNSHNILSLFALAGGGGSGGGGGGGGGSGGGDYIWTVIFLFIALFASNLLVNLIKKQTPRPTTMIITILGGTLSSIGILFLLPALDYEIIGVYITVCLIVGIWAGWYAAMFGFWDMVGKQLKAANTALATAKQADSSWDESVLLDHVTKTFLRFQDDWSRRDTSRFSEYLTPSYAYHMYLVLRALADMQRLNTVQDIEIIKCDFSQINDHADNSQDSFSVFIEAKATDSLISQPDNNVLFTDRVPFIAEWTFVRHETTWLLAGIRQSTEQISALEQSMANFATRNNMYFSLDWGWMLLPSRGELMESGRFGESDINNHVIGTYHDHLVQLYTYAAAHFDDIKKNTAYLVAQINLPKSYGGILIRRSKGIIGDRSLGAPSGYKRYEFEWPDFNKRYKVYATDADRLATFELLNPGFMAYLYDTFKDANIEVVDNVVYFYVENSLAYEQIYEQMMQVLEKAYKELQL
ncbi:MAG: hypothetical protein WAT17_01050 [Candidatus Saccharimonadales bacterium]|jgi:hypothetical protein